MVYSGASVWENNGCKTTAAYGEHKEDTAFYMNFNCLFTRRARFVII